MAAWKPILEELMRERAPRLLGYAVMLTGSPTEAEDLLHDAIIKTFGTGRSFGHVNAAEQYVRRAIQTTYIDRHRSRQALARALGRTRDPDPHVTDVDGGLDVQAALLQLPPRERVCVLMRFYDDLTVPQIARQLGIADGTVKRYLHHAAAKLVTLLDVEPAWLTDIETVPVAAHKEKR